jgi:hypothetical protein
MMIEPMAELCQKGETPIGLRGIVNLIDKHTNPSNFLIIPSFHAV